MILSLAKKILGTSNSRIIKKFSKTVKEINSLENEFEKLTDSEIKQKTANFKEQVSNGTSLEEILPAAFALVREATKRTLKMRHFDVQLIGGLALNNSMIAEMGTGEGKTLMATLPAYLNSLTGKGVHLITVNDYLARRDAEWMRPVYEALGVTVSYIVGGLNESSRKIAYSADITYGTNNEFGFDYLRDNMRHEPDHMVQRGHNYAIIDEVDSILIDEARTPLIISGPAENDISIFSKIDKIVRKFPNDYYEKDEKSRSITLNDQGIDYTIELLKKEHILQHDEDLYNPQNIHLLHNINQALYAHFLLKKDVDYLVKNDQIYIIDEFTGRIMEGRRYSDGLHQAIEAKESVKINNENQTLASVTYQNYFRLYKKLSGMAGTAQTEADEFNEIYGLTVLTIPTNKPIARKDEEDKIYRTAKEKYDAIIGLIEEHHKKGQPILVGTVSIENSEYLSTLLKKHKIKHQVLNAKYHDIEAQIIAQAGRLNAVTIATNMAGRGTDIKLGGNAEMLAAQQNISIEEAEKLVEEEQNQVLEAGGLLVIGTERHESRRIDNQLRGRSGRQGDPGKTVFFLSLEDDLMRIFGSDKLSSLLSKLGLEEGEAITHPWVSKALEKAQKKVEARNFEIRKNLLKFDDVMNQQRSVVYNERKNLINNTNITNYVKDLYVNLNANLVENFIPKKSYVESWDIESLSFFLKEAYGNDFAITDFAKKDGVAESEILSYLNEKTEQFYLDIKNKIGENLFSNLEKQVVLITLDELWKNHLHDLDSLRSAVNLRAYGQKDPLNEYKKESFNAFQEMLNKFNKISIQRVFALNHIEYQPSEEDEVIFSKPQKKIFIENSDNFEEANLSRNDSCHCGSGKKFKHCHGKIVTV